MYFEDEPQWAFGHGPSYTSFEYANLKTSSNEIARDGSVEIEVEVTNTGERGGDEIVQLYVRRPESKIARPLKALRGFQRVHLVPGEKATIELSLGASDLSHWDTGSNAWVVEPGPLEVMVGRSSRDADLVLRRTISVH